MSNSVTTFLFIKPTLAFACNVKRLIHLMFVPFTMIFMVLLLESRFPLFYLAQTAEIKMEINLYMLFFIGFSFLFVVFSLMLYVQKIIFFGEDIKTKKFFVPFFSKDLFHYVLNASYVFINAFFFALILGVFITSVLNYFLPMSSKINLYRVMATGVLFPYFIIRFSLCLPASCAGEKIRFWTSWRMTRRISPFMALIYGMFLLFPLTFVAIVYAFLGSMIGNESFVFFIVNLASLLSLFFSCVLYASYSAYLYTGILTEK